LTLIAQFLEMERGVDAIARVTKSFLGGE